MPADPALEEDAQEWTEWHPTMMACDATLLAVAPRGQGKTTMMLDCARKGGTKRGMIVCPTPELYKTYADRFPMLYCHAQFDQRLEDQIDNILHFHQEKSLTIHHQWKRIVAEMQEEAQCMRLESWRARMAKLEEKRRRHGWSREKIKRKVKRAELQQREEDERCKREREGEYARILNEMRLEYSWTCIWDDLAYDKAAMNSKSIAKSVKNGRHYIQKQMYACQAVRDFKCSNRDQIDLLAMSPLVTLSNVRRFMDDFIPSGFRKPAEFVAVLQTFAKHKWWLVINRRTDSLNPKDFIYRYRAEHEVISSGFIGSPGYILLHQLLYDPERAKRAISETASQMDEIQRLKDEGKTVKTLNARRRKGRRSRTEDEDAVDASDDDEPKGRVVVSGRQAESDSNDVTGDRHVTNIKTTRNTRKNKKRQSPAPGLFESLGPAKEMRVIQESDKARRNRTSTRLDDDSSGSDSSDGDHHGHLPASRERASRSDAARPHGLTARQSSIDKPRQQKQQKYYASVR